MKRSLKHILLLFILTSPLLRLGQLWVEEEKGALIELNNKHTKNKRIISISEFAEDLKLAAEQKIEGFIGWFLLSIFLVSILNQMMNI